MSPKAKACGRLAKRSRIIIAGGRDFPRLGRGIDPERIVITSGTSEAYDHVFRLLCEAGDEVLAPAPSYPLFDYLADLADVRAVPYRLFYDQGWQIDFAGLEAALTEALEGAGCGASE